MRWSSKEDEDEEEDVRLFYRAGRRYRGHANARPTPTRLPRHGSRPADSPPDSTKRGRVNAQPTPTRLPRHSSRRTDSPADSPADSTERDEVDDEVSMSSRHPPSLACPDEVPS